MHIDIYIYITLGNYSTSLVKQSNGFIFCHATTINIFLLPQLICFLNTVGVAHCAVIEDRLYNYSNTGKPDPNMNIELVQTLRDRCPQGLHSDNTVDLDQGPSSSIKVDNSYYNQLLLNEGILQFDQDLASSGLTNTTVEARTKSSYEDFNKNFAEAIVKLQALGVLTGTGAD
ncbi:Peroxidase [Parasponia andersonii]|uniref:peroxidase n=1 Tax=Parasponia andersonii TaxID=3476 RepID=A0A2P5CWK8_PARAD|nr:Peroxidase [Parasponia andersonii]